MNMFEEIQEYRESLDLYSATDLESYESVYGKHFLSPGGQRLARRCADRLHPSPEQTVLDVGSGLGGTAFVLVERYHCRVVGMDLTAAAVAESRRRSRELGLAHQVEFRQADVLELDESSRYDAVISRDVFLHIHDKSRLFQVLYAALKPGGKILITDYCCGEQPWPWSFSTYVAAKGYSLHTLDEYQSKLEESGFCDLRAQDQTELFIETLERELERLLANSRVGWTLKTTLALAWKAKLSHARSGAHRWGWFQARKPRFDS